MTHRQACLLGSCFLALFVFSCFATDDGPPMNALVSADGSLHLTAGHADICSFAPGIFEKGWKQAGATSGQKDVKAGESARSFKILTSGGGEISGESTFSEEKESVAANYQFVSASDLVVYSLHVSANFSAKMLAGQKWSTGDKSGVFPEDFKETGVFAGEISILKLTLAKGGELTLTFNAPTQVLLQDNRKWGPSFEIRIGPQNGGEGLNLKKGDTVKFGFTMSSTKKIGLEYDVPSVIAAGSEWIPLKLDLEIQPGSALDFSKMGFHDVPAGKFGRVIALPSGEFAFEKDPGTPRRFYGVNLCFGANYMSHEQADILADRLMRLGYNAVRIHHYEGELADNQKSSLEFNADKLDQLDYLLAAFGKRGIYVTTDLFVSRPIRNEELGIKASGNVEMDTFKILVPVHNAAFENWKSFTKNLLQHVNPYTKLRYADDPALAWLSMINEGLFGNFLDRERKIPEWNSAWNEWLSKQYADRAALLAAWKTELKDSEDFAKSTVAMPDNIYASNARTRDCIIFYSSVERNMIERMTKFLREDLKCTAMITNSNAWTNHISDQAARTAYDYVDDHFYIDHPSFLQRPWSLPSKCPNSNPIESGAPGGRSACFTRLFGKPFTITEYNYAAPGRFRGVGGILTGALGAIQGWSGIWRFAYSHSLAGVSKPERLDYFNMAADPMGQAAERASMCLFLRGDMAKAPHAITITTTVQEALSAKPMPSLSPGWNWAAWITRVGTKVAGAEDIKNVSTTAGEVALPMGDMSRTAMAKESAGTEGITPYTVKSDKIMLLLKSRGIISERNPTDPAKNVFKSETGEITIDGEHGILILDTPKTAGGFAPAGQTISCDDKRVIVSVIDSDATVWISSLDNKALSDSTHLLLTHLTDLQNTDIKYQEKARQTLLDWGRLPHLVRNGKAAIRLRLAQPEKFKVWALSTSGKRIGEVKTEVKGGGLEFVADVAEDAQTSGARMLYEIAQQ